MDILNELQINFYKKLDKKTGWGKEEVKREFERALAEILIEELGKQREKEK